MRDCCSHKEVVLVFISSPPYTTDVSSPEHAATVLVKWTLDSCMLHLASWHSTTVSCDSSSSTFGVIATSIASSRAQHTELIRLPSPPSAGSMSNMLALPAALPSRVSITTS